MEQLQIFKFNSNEVRTVIKDGEAWFVAKDVCDVLELGNSSEAVRKLDDEEKGSEKIDTLGGTQTMLVVNESGLYTLIIRSNMPNARPFRKWVTSEVLPSIRKHGAYMTDDVIQRTLADPEYIIGILTALSDNKKEIAIKNQIIGELKPKADYLDDIIRSKSLVTTTQISKDYGMSALVFNKLLHVLKVQFKMNDQWLLYSEYHSKGYTHSETVRIEHSDGRVEAKMNTKWTQKGRLFIYNLLKEHGTLPVIERT